MIERETGKHLLWLYLLLMVLVCWQLLFRTQVQTDMSAFMPGSKDRAQRLLLQQLEQGHAARLWMLALTQAPASVLAELSGKLARKATDSPLVEQVINGSATLDEATLKRLSEYRYLLSDRITNNSYSRRGLEHMFGELLLNLRSPMSTFSAEWAREDPGGEYPYLLQSLGGASTGRVSRHGVWFNEQGDKALLLLQSTASGTDLDAQLELRDQLQGWLSQLQQNELTARSVALEMGGVPVISLETRERIRQTSQRLSAIASLFMLGFMFLIYRQPRKVLLTVLPLLSGVLVGAACVSWWFGGIHGITLAFGITLLGVAVDYPVHLLSHQRQREALVQTAARIWPTLALSVLSTILGFSAMLWTDFPGLAQLGLFSVSGLLAAALVTRYLLPLVAGARTSSAPGFNWLSRNLARQPGGLWKVLLGSLLVFVIAWTINNHSLWSRDIRALSPLPVEVRLADQQMRQSMGIPEPGRVLLLIADSVQQLLVKQEQLRPLLSEAVTRGYVERTEYAARILPSEQLQLQRRSWIPSNELLATDLQAVLDELPFKTDSFTSFETALQQSRQLPPMTPEMLGGSVLGMRINSLVQQTDQGVTGLIRLVGERDSSALSDLLQESARDDLWLLDLPGATSDLVDRFRAEVTVKALLALALIALLAALWLRNRSRWMKVMTPVLMSVGVSVTVVLATGSGLNLFHLVSLLLVSGIGLDYALFFSRTNENAEDWQRTVQALGVCCVSTVVVFSLLAASDIPVLQAIGLTVASGAAAAFVLSWLIARGQADQVG